jgi:hypothetical protein
MKSKNFLLGILAIMLVFTMTAVGCAPDEEKEPPPPETATVSISIKEAPKDANSSTESGEVWIELELSSGKWDGFELNKGYWAPGALSNDQFFEFQSWISVKDKNNNTLAVVDRHDASRITWICAGGASSSAGRVLIYKLSVGRSVNLGNYKPITATLDTSKLNKMLSYTNVTGSLTAAKTSDTLK